MDDGIRNCLPSPNGYSYRIGDVNSNGVLAYGSFNNIIVAKLMWQPTFLGAAENCHSRLKTVRFNQFNEITPNVLASAGAEDVKIWDLEYNGLHLKNQRVFQHVSSIEWSSRLTDVILVAHSKNIITKWNVEEDDKEDMTCGDKTDEITIISSNPSKSIVAIGYKNGFAALFDIESCRFKQKIFGHQKELTNISISWHSNQVLTSSFDGVVCVWTIEEDDDDTKGRVCHEWRGGLSDVCAPFAVWHPTKHNVVIATTSSGQIGGMDLSTDTEGEIEIMIYKNDLRMDNKMFNSLFSSHKLPRAIYTFSKDRMLTLWDLEREIAITELYTYKSSIKCIAFPPISTGISGTLAIASNEKNMLFWDTTSDPKVFESKAFYNSISSVIISLAWHPQDKKRIAFGTEDGNVAIIEDWKSKSKPTYSNLKHEDMVTFLCWGPCSKLTDNSPATANELALFSSGKGKLLIHFKDRSLNFYEIIQSTDRKYFTSICWKDDFSMFATGSGDGTMDIYDGKTFELLVEIVVSATSVLNIAWHPKFYLQDGQKIESSLHSWIAAYFSYYGVLKGEIVIYDIQKDLVDKLEHQKPIQSVFIHSMYTNSLAWSPHVEEHLACAATDGIISIWNMVPGHLLCKFAGHFSSVQTVAWSPVDKEVVFSGTGCCTLFSFNCTRLIQEQRLGAIIKRRIPRFGSRQVTTSKVSTSSSESDDEESVIPEKDSVIKEKDSVVKEKDSVVKEKDSVVKEMDSVVKEKESIIAEKESIVKEKESVIVEKELVIAEKEPGMAEKEPVMAEMVPDVSEELLKDLPLDSNVKTPGKSNCTPAFLSAALDKISPEQTSKYVRLLDTYLTKKKNNCIDEETVRLGEGELQYLGVFGDKEDILRMVQAQSLSDDASQSDRIIFDLWWKNDLTEQAKSAIANGTITDELFGYVPQVSRSLWREVCLAYAKQLENEGSYYKAVICLLLCHKVRDAIHLLKDKNIVDALMLARRYIFDEEDPLLNEVIESFKQQFLEGKLDSAGSSTT